MTTYRKQWLVTPETELTVRRRCPKCGQKTEFVNSGKFRVNGNGKLLDVWLIYRCHRCKSTWNMTICERIPPDRIDREEYKGFMGNAAWLALKYGSSRELFIKNGAEAVMAQAGYTVKTVCTQTPCEKEGTEEIEVWGSGFFRLRADTLFAQQWNMTRSQVKKMFDQRLILSGGDVVEAGSRVRDGQVFSIIWQ